MTAFMKFCNDNHWYLIAAGLMAALAIWTYGCQSTVPSLLHPEQQIGRTELQNELDYIIGQAQVKAESLDQQDAVKQALLDAVNVIGVSGSINPSGMISLFASIGGVAFGLNRNQAAKKATTELAAIKVKAGKEVIIG